jgi:hypothetical protein
MKKLNDGYLSVNPGPVTPHYLHSLNRRRKSPFTLGFLSLLIALLPATSKACPNIYFPSCTYTMPVNGVPHRFVNVVIDQAYWNCWYHSTARYRFEVFASGSTVPFYNSNIFPLTTPLTNAYILNLGPTSSTPVPFSVNLYESFGPSYSVEIPLGTEFVTTCGDPTTVDAEQTACVYKNGAASGGKTLLKTTVTPSWLAHAAFMAASGYSIQLKVVIPSSPGVFVWIGNPYKIVGNDVYYDISTAPIDIKKCNNYLVQLVNSAGIPESPAIGRTTVQFCPCTSLACDAEFNLGLNVSSSGTVASFKSMYQGTMIGHNYTVTNGGSVIYSGTGTFTTIPSGTTTICHTVRTPTALDGLYDDCEVCKTVCYSVDNRGNPDPKLCDPDFTVTFDPYDLTDGALTFYRTSVPLVASETYTVTGPSFSATYTSAQSVLVPYGSYRICHTVVSYNGSSCTSCIDVCMTTESSSSSSDGIVKRTTGVSGPAQTGPGDFMLQPNPATDMTNISFNLQSATDLKLEVVDALGRVIRTNNYKYSSQGKYRVELNTSDLSTGVYTLRLTTKLGSRSERLCVVH